MPRMDLKDDGSARIIEGIERIDPEFFVHVPCSSLTKIIDHFEAKPGIMAFPATREEEAVGILSGLSLAGRRAVLAIQDNGFGNCLTALTTFPQAYHIPIFILATRRGGLNEYNSMIHHFCEHVVDAVSVMQIKNFHLDTRTPMGEWPTVVKLAYEHALMTHRPVVVFADLQSPGC